MYNFFKYGYPINSIGGLSMESIQKIALVFTIIGAIAWGIIGLFNVNVVEMITGGFNTVSRIIYTLVGICGVINIGLLFYHLKMDH